MHAREFNKARLACVAANREVVEHRLEQLYHLMGWPAFSHVVYTSSPAAYKQRASSPHWSWGSYSTTMKNRGRKLSSRLSRSTETSDPWRDLVQVGRPEGAYLLRCNTSDRELNAIWPSLAHELLDFRPQVELALVCEKPLEAHFSADGRPHCDDGPAVIWRDGSREWWIGGVKVTRRFVEEEPTISYINGQFNQERKRLLIERYGPDRYLKDMNAKLRQEDDAGKLWLISGRGGRWTGPWGRTWEANEDIQFVEVINSSPEPDGSYSHYFLRVPPTVKTAREAVAWTFRVPTKNRGRAWRPKVET